MTWTSISSNYPPPPDPVTPGPEGPSTDGRAVTSRGAAKGPPAKFPDESSLPSCPAALLSGIAPPSRRPMTSHKECHDVPTRRAVLIGSHLDRRDRPGRLPVHHDQRPGGGLHAAVQDQQ